ATREAFADLWRFLLGVDLVDRIEAPCRPADEPLEPLLTDPRSCSVTWAGDDLWLRLVDVPRALSARSYAPAGRVVIDVRDAVLPANAGRFEVSDEGVIRSDRAAQVRIDVDALAMLYLGTWRPSDLLAAGRLEVVDAKAVATFGTLLGTDTRPWCGTFF
ncbi:MAG: sterol carrier protein domain-containing protein, partial [Pseudonocardiaceae bacterium]